MCPLKRWDFPEKEELNRELSKVRDKEFSRLKNDVLSSQQHFNKGFQVQTTYKLQNKEEWPWPLLYTSYSLRECG